KVKAEGIVNEVVEQIAYAERLVVNKKINRMAHLKQTQFGNVDLDYALGIRVFDFERIESVITEESSKEYHDHHNNHDHHLEHKHEHEPEHEHALLALNAGHAHDHTHDPGGSAINIICEGSLDLDKANMWLGALLLERDDDIYRIKDFYLFRVWMKDLCFRYGTQVQRIGSRGNFLKVGVHDIFKGSSDRPGGPNEPRTNKL
ncbi:COBW domain-containing protein 2, partial [Bienertia sinuspersici]